MEDKIIKLIKEYQNPYPSDIFLWDNHKKLDFDRGRFNKHCFQIVENVRQDIVNLIEENLTKHNNDFKASVDDIPLAEDSYATVEGEEPLPKPCPNCDGKGKVERELSGLGLRELYCPKCNGQGFIKS